jgi:hypothetical protein
MIFNTNSAPIVTIRSASSLDAPRLSTFARRTFQETFAAQNTPEDMNIYLSSAFTDAAPTGRDRGSRQHHPSR